MTDYQESIYQIYEQVESQASELLQLQGFELLEREIDREAFGSQYTIWINSQNNEAIRFVWDGKESWFVLEESPIVGHLETWHWPWADILLHQVDKANFSNGYIDSIVKQFVDELK